MINDISYKVWLHDFGLIFYNVGHFEAIKMGKFKSENFKTINPMNNPFKNKS